MDQPAWWLERAFLSALAGRFEKAVHRYSFSREVWSQAEGLGFYWSHLETSVSNQLFYLVSERWLPS